jgi:hypothetical protein
MEKKMSWDDIPSLDRLEMDWEYKPESAFDKRSFIRLKQADLLGLFEVKEIVVKVSTVKKIYTGNLFDISVGGLSVSLSERLEENLPLKVGFFLGRVRIVSRALVRHTCKSGEQHQTGIMFVGLDKHSSEFIAELYASKILYLAN